MNITRRAIFSVSDSDQTSSNVLDFARALIEHGWEIVASEATFLHLGPRHKAIKNIAMVTEQRSLLNPEIASLHPAIHAGLVATDDQRMILEGMGYPFYDLVYVIPSHLEALIMDPHAVPEDIREHTDLAGIAMLRAAAKGRKLIATNRERMHNVVQRILRGEADDDLFRLHCAAQTELFVAAYSTRSANHLEQLLEEQSRSSVQHTPPVRFS